MPAPSGRILHIGKYFAPATGGVESVTRELMTLASAAGWSTDALVHHHGLLRHADSREGPHRVRRARVATRLLYTPIAPLFLRDLDRMLDARPTLLHIHLPNLSAFWCLVSKRARAVPWIIHWHSDVLVSGTPTLLGAAYLLYARFERLLLKRAAAIVVTNPRVLEASRVLPPYRDKCQVIPLTTPIPKEPAASSPPSDASERWPGLTILTVARLSVYKGHLPMLGIMAELARRGIRFRWQLVGEGDEETRIRRRIRQLRLEGYVELLGSVDQDRLQALYQACDLFLLPSVSPLEAFGLVLLEAMRAGKPCVVQAVPGSGMSWIVQDGITGRVVPLGDARAMTEALVDAARQPDHWAALGRAGRARVNETFTPERVHAAWLALYARVRDAGMQDQPSDRIRPSRLQEPPG